MSGNSGMPMDIDYRPSLYDNQSEVELAQLESEQDEDRPLYSDDHPGDSSLEFTSGDDEEQPLLSPPDIPYEHNTDMLPPFFQQQFTDEVESPNDMLVDTDDLLADAENEKDDVAIINPDSDAEPPLRASDCRSIGSSWGRWSIS